MSDDRRRPAQYESARDDVLRSWLGSTVHPYSPALGPVLDEHGFKVRGRADGRALRRLPVVSLAELGDGRRHVLEPTVHEFGRTAALSLQVRFLLDDVVGRRDQFARRHIDPLHRPVVWTVAPTEGGHLFVANTARDLDRLAVLGRRALATAGVRDDDRMVLVGDGGDELATWQLVLGCRDAGVALLRRPVSDPDAPPGSEPTVVAGTAAALRRIVLPPSVGRLLVLDGADVDVAPGHDVPGQEVAVARWWAPPPVRAAWPACPGGGGYHTWPEDELVELVEGRLVWSAVGWHGSVWLRVDTGVEASLAEGPCPHCDRTTPRVIPEGDR